MIGELLCFEVQISRPYLWFRKSTREWVVSCTFATDNTTTAVNFSSKKKNKAKRNFYLYLMKDSVASEEFKYLLSQNLIHITEMK